MSDHQNCYLCGWMLGENDHYCANCGRPLHDHLGLQPTQSKESSIRYEAINREAFIPRLGDYLVQSEELTPEDLQSALDYQKLMAIEGTPLTLGQALLALDLIDRDVLDGAITQQLIALQGVFKTANQQLEQRVEERTVALEKRLYQVWTAAEVTEFAVSASSLGEMLQRVVDILVDRFEFYYASIFLCDEAQQAAVLSAATGSIGVLLLDKAYQIAFNSHSIVSWVCSNNRPRLANDVEQDELYLPEELLPETKSELCVPIASSDRVIGVIDIQHDQIDAFEVDFIKVLQTISDHISSMIGKFRSMDMIQANYHDISRLFSASQKLSKAANPEEVIEIAVETLHESPYLSLLFLSELHGMRIRIINIPAGWESQSESVQGSNSLDFITISPIEVAGLFEPGADYLVMNIEGTLSVPDALTSIPRQMGCRSVALLPLTTGGNLRGLFMIGSRRLNVFTPDVLKAYISLTDLVNTALENSYTLRKMERRLAALQSLNTISQAVSIETDLMKLYEVVHNEVRKIMGSVSFLIALYDGDKRTIQIPYSYELNSTEITQQPALPLREGLMSMVINSHRPLMIVEDTEEKIHRLGDKTIGQRAKSWLGVPLVMAGDVIGVMVIQDEYSEGKFDEEDQSVLMSLASQVAVAIRNTHLLESTYNQAERERKLYEITSQLRSSTDAQVIIQTMTTELSRALGARRARAEVKIPIGESS